GGGAGGGWLRAGDWCAAARAPARGSGLRAAAPVPAWAPGRRSGQVAGRTGRTHPAPRLRRASFVRQASPRARRDRQTDKLASNSLKVKVLIGEATNGG